MKTVAKDTGLLLDTLEDLVPGASRRTLRQMLAQDRIRVNGTVCRKAGRSVQLGDRIEIGPRRSAPELPPGLEIVFEDDTILIALKPSGLLTASTPDEREETAFAILRRYLKERDSVQSLQIIHRLDKFASGLLVFAKNDDARRRLKDLFSRHDVRRKYWAVVEGRVGKDTGTIRSYLKESRDFRVRSVKAGKGGKPAVTHYRVLRRFPDMTMLEVTLETGRKNQIRVHLAEIGHPVVGDRTYGRGMDPLGRLGLHAFHLGFTHPTHNKPVDFTSDPPPEFQSYLTKESKVEGRRSKV